MTRDEAAQILEVSPRAAPRQCDAAYAKALRSLTLQLQHQTVPAERDVLSRGIGLVGEAYEVLTGAPPPSQVPATKSGSAAKSPPKARLCAPSKAPAKPAAPPTPRRSILNNQPAPSKPKPVRPARKQPPAAPQHQTPPPRPPSRDPVPAPVWAIIAAIVFFALAFVFTATR